MRVRVRLLPVTIFVATLMLSVKAGGLWRGQDRAFDFMPVTESSAATAAEGETKPAADGETKPVASEGEKAGETSEHGGGEGKPAAEGETKPDASEGEKAGETSDHGGGEGKPGNISAVPPQAIEEPTVTDAEATVLDKLKARREQLDQRAQALDLRENTVRAAEHTLQSRIDEYQRLKTEVETLLRSYDEQQEKELQTLAIYYEKMKPKDAARVFDNLDMTYLVDIIRRMKEAKVAEIIGRMDTARAEALTSELAKKPDMREAADADPNQKAIARN